MLNEREAAVKQSLELIGWTSILRPEMLAT